MMNDYEQQGAFTRRNFVKGSAAALAGATALSLAACSGSGSDDPVSSADWLPETWDGEADIIVIGYGGAGAAAAITSVKEELGSVMVLEAASEGEEGGNTRCAMQAIFIPPNAEGAIKYQTALNGPYAIEEELMRAWADELVLNKSWLESLGAKVEAISAYSPEFPTYEGSEYGTCFAIDGALGNETCWAVLKAQEATLGYKVRYASRALELVRNPLTNEALGVIADEQGSKKAFKAHKGIILACGGFENNQEMMMDYYDTGVPDVRPMGTPHNRGDGFQMIAPFGAKLWHMNSILGTRYAGKASNDDLRVTAIWTGFTEKDYIWVGPDGRRFMYEEKAALARHGKVEKGGVYTTLETPTRAFAIFGQKSFDGKAVMPDERCGWLTSTHNFASKTNQGFLDVGLIFKADTVAELATKLKLDENNLTEELERYNASVVAGIDAQFGRGAAVYGDFAGAGGAGTGTSGEEIALVKAFALEPIVAPYYAVEIFCSILNTAGGPKRSAKGEVLDINEQPVPRLYAAGEFGCIYGYLYNGGGNLSEAMSSGRIAVRSVAALEPWKA